MLDCEREGGVDAEAHGLALGVEGVEVDVRDYAEGCGRAVAAELVQVFVGEAGFGDAAGGDGVEGVEWGGGEGGCKIGDGVCGGE